MNKIWIVPPIIACALFMETLDTTILSTAIPTMSQYFQVSPISLKLALTSYLISLSLFIPISGWLADKFGAKNIFLGAMSLFILSSFFCGISNGLLELICFRILQGFGGALMMPVGRLIIFQLFPKEDMVKATNYVTIPSLFGPMLGPVIGGIIITFTTWHWIFLVNIPIGLLGIYFGLKYIPNIPLKKVNPFDWKGFVFFGTGLSSFAFLLSTFQEDVVSSKIHWILFSTSLLFFTVFFIYSKYFHSTFINFNLFRVRTFSITALGSFISRMGIGGIPFLLPLFFQLGFLFSPLVSGFLIFPLALGMWVMKFWNKRIVKKFGFRKCLIGNTILLSLTVASYFFLTKNSSLEFIVLLVFLNGLFVSLQFSCTNIMTYYDLDNSLLSQGTSIGSSLQQLSMGFGVTLGAMALKFFLDYFHSTHFSFEAFHGTFLLLGSFTLVATIFFLFLKEEDGQKASGYLPRSKT